MSNKIMKQLVDCPIRQRVVEVICKVSGHWFDREYSVVSCPAMYDAGPVCSLRCRTQLGNRPLTNPACLGLRS